jgi:hypothetical protein
MDLLDYNNILLCSSLFFISMSTSLLVLIPVVYFMKAAPETKILEQDTDIDTQSEGEDSLNEEDESESEGSEEEGSEEQGSEEESKASSESEGCEEQGSEEQRSEEEQDEKDEDFFVYLSEEFNKLGGLKLYVSVEDAPNDKWIRVVDRNSIAKIFKFVLEKPKSE